MSAPDIDTAAVRAQWRQDGKRGHPYAILDALDAARADNERQQVQLAGVTTAATGYISDPATPEDYGWSVPYQLTLELRMKYNAATARVAALEAGMADAWRSGYTIAVRDSIEMAEVTEPDLVPVAIGTLRDIVAQHKDNPYTPAPDAPEAEAAP